MGIADAVFILDNTQLPIFQFAFDSNVPDYGYIQDQLLSLKRELQNRYGLDVTDNENSTNYVFETDLSANGLDYGSVLDPILKIDAEWSVAWSKFGLLYIITLFKNKKQVIDVESDNEDEEEEEEEDEDAGEPLPEWKAIDLAEYQSAYRNSWIYDELYEIRNVRPAFDSKLGLLGGLAVSGLVTMITRGKEPFTLEHNHTDASRVEDASKHKKIDYPKPDGVITFDLMTSVNRTGTYHREGERCHLRVPDMDLQRHKEDSWPKFKGVEQRFCPAGVYEYVKKNEEGNENDVEFVINSQNCIHCKTCDIKVPSQDINWTVPEGGDGPKYQMT